MNRFIHPAAKVRFPLPAQDGGLTGEVLWAEEVGRDRYRIENCPFFAYAVSLHDIVMAPADRTGIPTFRRVLRKSGNRTIRVAFSEPFTPGGHIDELLKSLVSFGCGYEGADARLFAVNIPARVRLDAVRDYLVRHAVSWELADPPDEVSED